MEEIKDIPIVFTAVTNPGASGIAHRWERPGQNITGTSNWVESDYKIKIFSEMVLTLKKLGVIYNPQNPVPFAEVGTTEKIAGTMGITIIKAHIYREHEIEAAIDPFYL